MARWPWYHTTCRGGEGGTRNSPELPIKVIRLQELKEASAAKLFDFLHPNPPSAKTWRAVKGSTICKDARFWSENCTL